MDVEARLLLLQHLNRTALRRMAGAAGTLPPDVKKRIFSTMESLVWSLDPGVFEAAEAEDPEDRAAEVAADPRVAERFEAAFQEVQSGGGA